VSTSMNTDYQTLTVEITAGVAVFTIDNPPVNQMSPQMAMDFRDAIEGAMAEDGVNAVVLTGTGKNFIAGADITQLQAVKTREEIFEKALASARFLNGIETGRKPVVAAINGNCLGGGLETAMACHYRLATPGVNLGQPEVMIGLIPGAGGTQRLPRLIGLPNALEMITVGKPIKAEKALSRGLVDEVVEPEQLIPAAIAAAQRFIKKELNVGLRMTRSRHDRLPSTNEKKALLQFARGMTAAKAKGYVAPFKALDAFEQGLSSDIEGDIEMEVGLFADCVVTDVAKNLIGIFLNSRAAGRLPRIEGIAPADIRKVAMLGGGVMGSGIVSVLIKNGFDTVLWDIDEMAIAKGVAAVRKTFDFPIKKKKMTQSDLDKMLEKKLRTTTDLADLKDVDLVIEAVLENMAVKQDIWKKLESTCPHRAIFATNTSALPIAEMASILTDPGRMIGLHFFNPAHRMQLLEVICAEKTSDQTLANSVAFSRAIKKIPVVVNDGPGFYVSRQLSGLLGAAVFLTADGVDGALIEEAMTDFGLPMGPATLSDLTGIDINYHVSKTFEKRLGDRYSVHPLTERIYQVGDYGRKSGAGYFDYSGAEPVPNPKIVDVVGQYLSENSVPPKEISKEEVAEIMLALGVNEAALMIEQGICDRPQDMDLAMIYGCGFPPYRGGVLRYADKLGASAVVDKLIDLENRYGQRFKPAALLKEMAEEGKTFYPK